MSIDSQFSFDLPENSKVRSKDLIKLSAYGISLVPDPHRPLLLLKDQKGEHNLPVTINPLEAGMALTQFNNKISPVAPHKISEILLASLDIKIEKCVFVEIKGSFQYVRLFIKNHPQLKSIKVRADEAMSFCLHLNIPFFATPEFMNASRNMNFKGVPIINDETGLPFGGSVH